MSQIARRTTTYDRRTQRERRELSHRRIIDAAIKLIARKGSSQTTIAEMGEYFGFANGLVGARFGSKTELIHALTAQLRSDFLKATSEVLEGRRGLGALLIYSEICLRIGTSLPKNALYVLIGEALGPVGEMRPEISDLDRKSRFVIQKFIEEGIHDGEIRSDADPAALAAIVLGLLRGVVTQWLINNQAFALDVLWKELETTISRALAH